MELTNTSNDLQPKLTAKNRVFLELLSQGVNTVLAHKQAGYQGDDHAAYELKCKLSKDFESYLTAKGMSRGDLMLAVKRLIDSPVEEYEGKSIKDQIKLLTLWLKMLPTEPTNRPAITAFVINNHNTSNLLPSANVASSQPLAIDVDPNTP